MKKPLLALALATVPHLAFADTILGLYAGVGQWNLSLDGEVSYVGAPIDLTELGIEDETSTEMWLNFEHPIPIIPNIRLMHSMIEIQETSVVTREIIFGNAQISADVEVYTDMDLSHSDVTLYYELLDNWVSLDVGVTGRMLDGYVDVISEIQGQEGSADLKGVVPMIYVNTQIDLPFTGWNIGAYGNAASYKSDRITDVAAKIGYEFELVPLVDIGVNLGYRLMSLKTESLDELFADAELSGVYAEFQLHF